MIEDDGMAVLRLVPPQDVSGARAERLRRRCHVLLQTRAAPRRGSNAALAWRRLIAPAVNGAGSAIYLIETFRAAAALYGF
jgi:hypothetical protein